MVGSRMTAAKRALSSVYNKAKDCRYSIVIGVLLVALVATVVLAAFVL